MSLVDEEEERFRWRNRLKLRKRMCQLGKAEMLEHNLKLVTLAVDKSTNFPKLGGLTVL